jgi:hypothetical protein
MRMPERAPLECCAGGVMPRSDGLAYPRIIISIAVAFAFVARTACAARAADACSMPTHIARAADAARRRIIVAALDAPRSDETNRHTRARDIRSSRALVHARRARTREDDGGCAHGGVRRTYIAVVVVDVVRM